MLLYLIMSGKSDEQAYFPDSGPGSKTLLVGNKQVGFFGEVTATELFDGARLLPLIKGTAPTNQKITGAVWLKYYFNNSVIYIAKQNLVSNVSWDQLYASGLVYGTSNNGVFPAAVPVNQTTVIDKESEGKTYRFKVRTIRGSVTDPTVPPYTSDGQSEWERTILNSLATAGPGKLADYTVADLSINGQVHTLATETASNATTACLYLGTGSNIVQRDIYGKATIDGGPNWRPVLQLVDLSVDILPVDRPKATRDGLVAPVISADTNVYADWLAGNPQLTVVSPKAPYLSGTVVPF